LLTIFANCIALAVYTPYPGSDSNVTNLTLVSSVHIKNIYQINDVYYGLLINMNFFHVFLTFTSSASESLIQYTHKCTNDTVLKTNSEPEFLIRKKTHMRS